MTLDTNDMRTRILTGAVTNYLRVGIRFIKTIFLTRILLLNLGDEYYGFWALLWSIFGYILLLELGFGKTVQKFAAEAVASNDYKQFVKIVQAVFSSYLGIGLIIMIVTAGLSWFLPDLFKLPKENVGYYQITFLVFGLGCAVVFPTGIIPELLVGIQRLHYRNWAIILNNFLELAGIWLIFKCGGSLLTIAIFIALNNLLANLLMSIWVYRLIPGLRLRPGKLSLSTLKEITSFSAFVYLMAIANLILLRTDPLVLGTMLGMEAVALYQIGTRIPELMKMGTGQIQETIGPAAAMFRKNGQTSELRTLMTRGVRFSTFVAMGAIAIFYPLTGVILKVWLNVDQPIVIFITRLMLVNTLLFIAFRDTAQEVLVMTGRHRLLAWIAVSESLVNLILSIILVKYMGLLGVVYGTLIPNVLIALFLMLPISFRFVQMRFFHYMAVVYLPSILTALPIWILLMIQSHFYPSKNWNFMELAVILGISGVFYLSVGVFTCLTGHERRNLFLILKNRNFSSLRKQ